MKTIILAGGLGSRLAEETDSKPKPMVKIGEYPILWHIMSIYAKQGYDDFLIATGYKHELIDDWVATLRDDWKISTLFTGDLTQTGGRILRCISKFPEDEYFITYGDGLANVNLNKLLNIHHSEERLATVTAVRPPARFGVLTLAGNRVTHFGEKSQAEAGWINGGFMIVSHRIKDIIQGDGTLLETGPLPHLAASDQLSVYRHDGFWHPMDTLREKNVLSELASAELPPWFEIN